MSMEQMGGQQMSQAEKETQMGNMMQIELAMNHGEDLEYFVDTHGVDFRKALNSHPELVKTYEKDPQAALSEIEKIIYHH